MSDSMMSASDAEFQTQMDALMKDAIADVVKDLPPAPDLDFTEVVAEATQGLEPEPAKEAAPVEPAQPAQPPKPDRVAELEALLAKRESEFEAKLREFEAKLRPAEPPPAPKQEVRDLAREIEEDPVGFFERAGIAPEQVARLVIATRLGDKAPPEVRDAIQRHKDKSEVAALRREIEAERTARIVERLRSGAEAAVAKSESPVISALRAVDADELAQRVFEKVAQDAQKRNLGPNDKFLPYEDAVKAVEADLSKYHRAFGSTAQAAPAAGQAPAEAGTVSPAPAGTPGGKEVQRPRRAAPPRKPYWEADDWEAERVAALQESLQIARGNGPRA